MVKYIKFGEYNKNYKFIVLLVIFEIIYEFLFNILIDIFSHYNIISQKTIVLFNYNDSLSNCILLCSFPIAYIFYKYEKKLYKAEANNNQSKALILDKGCYKSITIKEENQKKLNNKKNILKLIMIMILEVIVNCLKEIYISLNLNIFSFYMIVLLILSLINSKMFKLKVYRHQKCSIIFNFIVVFIFQLSSFIICMKSEEKNDYIVYRKYMWFISIGLIIYFLISIINSYICSKLKWFMDYNWISVSKLFMISLLVNFLMNIIKCVIETFIKCGDNFKSYLCKIYDDENKNYYVDNFLIFFNKIKIVYTENKVDLIIIIILILLFAFFVVLNNTIYLIILSNLYPEYYFFSSFIQEIILKIIYLFYNKIQNGYYFDKEEKKNKERIRFILDLIWSSLSFVGFLIYLEIIELNFFGLNYNLRKYIRGRSINEMLQENNSEEEHIESLFNDDNSNKISELSTNNMN